MNIYVFNIPAHINDKELESLFSCYGEVWSVQLEKDNETGQSLSAAYIHMPIEYQAQQAIVALNGMEVYGQKIFVREEGHSTDIQTFT